MIRRKVERSRRRFAVRWKDRSNNVITPSTVHYRVDCQTTDSVVLDWTQTTASAEVTITIPATILAMIDTANAVERKTLLIVANKDTSSAFAHEVEFEIERAQGYNA